MRQTQTLRPNGYVLHEAAAWIAIATGFERASENRKTGGMVQIWILPKALDPVRAQASGRDAVVCGSCPLRPVNAAPGEARCYVNIGQAPYAVWHAWKRGTYPQLPSVSLFAGKAVRFGAYGDPALLPLPLIESIAAVASRWTGYTHRWAQPLVQGYRRFLMASTDDVDCQIRARTAGWRTFRVAPKGSDFRLVDEIVCPASKEAGNRTVCAKCGLCAGTSKPAKSIVIQDHSNN